MWWDQERLVDDVVVGLAETNYGSTTRRRAHPRGERDLAGPWFELSG